MTNIYYSFQADKAICEDTIRQLLERCEQLDAKVEVSLGISFFDLYRVVGHVMHMCVYTYMYVHVCRYMCVYGYRVHSWRAVHFFDFHLYRYPNKWKKVPE